MPNRRLLASLLLAALTACGGSTSGPNPPPPPPPPPGPAPVATVSLSHASASLVPQFTVQLSATTKDAAGNPLAGRTVTWQSGTATVASVSSDGLVTGLTVGTATVTATSEGRSASASVTVSDGAVIGPAGGTVIAAGGNAKIIIPAGALTAPLPISVTPLATPPTPAGILANTAYELGPSGTTFAQPVTLEFRYPPSNGIDSSQAFYRISRHTNGAWVPLPGSSGGKPGSVVTAQTSSFSTYGIWNVPIGHYGVNPLDLTPNTATIFVGQSIQLFAVRAVSGQYPPFEGPFGAPVWIPSPQTTVSQTGVVTGVTPGGPGTVFVMETYEYHCATPCYVGTDTLSQVPVFADILYYPLGGQALVTVTLVPVKAITVGPTPSTVAAGQQVTLTATLKDSIGGTLSQQHRTIGWATSNAAIASVSQAGVVTTHAVGQVTITASAEGISGTAQVSVTAPTTPVASVFVQPTNGTVEVGGVLTMTATPKDGNGNPILGKTVIWSTLDPTRATVSAAGVVTGVSPGSVGIGASVDGVQDGAFVTVIAAIPLVMGSPSAGDQHTCFLRSNATLWCWGGGALGQLGNGTQTAAQLGPAAVTAGAGFTRISAGVNHTCALDGVGKAHCWGDNPNGQLGDNSLTRKLSPGPVADNRTFAKIYASRHHTCALDGAGLAFCWGSGTDGRLGDGNSNDHQAPVPVVLAPAYSELAVGRITSCGLSLAGEAWCWGHGLRGEAGLGGALAAGNLTATKITGTHLFSRLAGGDEYFCGLKANGEVWCWGRGTEGQLGNGGQTSSSTPVKVSTPVSFTAIAAGTEVTCGLAQDQTAWCWGLRGLVGDGLAGQGALYRTTPVAVTGGRQFTEIDAGNSHTCARAADGTWCWGTSSVGQLGTGQGNGGGVSFLPPMKVVFP